MTHGFISEESSLASSTWLMMISSQPKSKIGKHTCLQNFTASKHHNILVNTPLIYCASSVLSFLDAFLDR